LQARELLKDAEYAQKESFVVVADTQSAGRGTRGRTWVSVVGNLYMTLVLNMGDVPLPLTLTPIRIGAFIIQAIDKALIHKDFCLSESTETHSSTPLVQLKWPNDVIINSEKVSGVLIEIEQGKLLVGIGVNIANAPAAPTEGPDSGCREATALSRHLSERTVTDEQMTLRLRNYLATEIYDAARFWVGGSSGDTVQAALNDFQLRMDDSWQVSYFSWNIISYSWCEGTPSYKLCALITFHFFPFSYSLTGSAA
jgi:biotin-[acetyl-CoA-carboxylase] ligase BirA-like protein